MAVLRAVAAVIVGYIVTAAVVFAIFTSVWLALGTEGVFKPGSYDAVGWFNWAGLGVSLVAGFIGGFVCALIGRSWTPVLVYAVIVLVAGLLMGVLNMNKPDPGPRAGDLTLPQILDKAKQPDWYAFSTPFVGALAVALGGRLRKR